MKRNVGTPATIKKRKEKKENPPRYVGVVRLCSEIYMVLTFTRVTCYYLVVADTLE